MPEKFVDFDLEQKYHNITTMKGMTSMLKRVLCGLLAIVMLLSMVGCAGGNNLTPTNPTQPTGEATEPSGNVTEPTVDVTDPTIENGVTEPSAEATEPSEEATEPPVSDAPTEAPTEKPTEAPTEHVHSYTSKIVAPTCTEKGYTKYTCECGDSYKEDYVDKLEHTYTSKVVKPTCEAKGYTKYTCECGESYKEDYVAKIDHIYEGNKCTMCGEKKSGPINGMDIVKEAVQYIGLEYVYGGNSLTKGTDCSGFTSLIYKKYGISLPRTAAEQSKVGKKVTLAEAKPGDLYAVKYEDA